MTQQTVNVQPVEIEVCDVVLKGFLSIPLAPKGIIIFAHGSGSSRFSPRNQYIANKLLDVSFATFLFDLLSSEEEALDSLNAQFRFNIPFLAKRLVAVTNWIANHKDLTTLTIGYFGASTGAGAALVAAAELKHQIRAVVSRGGRPDLADKALAHVTAPTLLIVGGNDEQVIELNQQALESMQCVKKLTIVPDATHLFEEPGKLAEVSMLANAWFQQHMVS